MAQVSGEAYSWLAKASHRGTMADQSDVSPSPQANRIATLSPFGSIADAAKRVFTRATTSAWGRSRTGASGGSFGGRSVRVRQATRVISARRFRPSVSLQVLTKRRADRIFHFNSTPDPR